MPRGAPILISDGFGRNYGETEAARRAGSADAGQDRRPSAAGGRTNRIEDRPLSSRTFHSTGAVSFSTKGEYGVRLMAQLGRRYGTGPASLTDIAEDEELPRAYLEQLVTNLRDAGLVVSTRGARGGYELARAPETIPMSEILRALEGPIAPMICASVDPEHATTCDRTGRCTVNVLWVRVRDAISGALDSMTLADLVPPPPAGLSLPAIRQPAAIGAVAATVDA